MVNVRRGGLAPPDGTGSALRIPQRLVIFERHPILAFEFLPAVVRRLLFLVGGPVFSAIFDSLLTVLTVIRLGAFTKTDLTLGLLPVEAFGRKEIFTLRTGLHGVKYITT